MLGPELGVQPNNNANYYTCYLSVIEIATGRGRPNNNQHCCISGGCSDNAMVLGCGVGMPQITRIVWEGREADRPSPFHQDNSPL